MKEETGNVRAEGKAGEALDVLEVLKCCSIIDSQIGKLDADRPAVDVGGVRFDVEEKKAAEIMLRTLREFEKLVCSVMRTAIHARATKTTAA